MDGYESLRLTKGQLSLLLSDPEIKQLCEKAKLRDPKIGGNHYLKLESSILVAAVIYKFYNNDSEDEITEMIQDFDRLNIFVTMNQQNLRKSESSSGKILGETAQNPNGIPGHASED